MPYIFISTVALCANLYRCAPLIVGDKYADPELMRFLGAKITTDYPEPNSPPMYVMFATMRSVLNALQEVGYELNSSHVVQGYTTWVLFKPLEGDPQPAKSSDEVEREPQKRTIKPRREEPTMKDKGLNTEDKGLVHCCELTAKEVKELRELSARSLKTKVSKTESEEVKKEAPRKPTPAPGVDESTSTKDLSSVSVKIQKEGSNMSRAESSLTRRQKIENPEPRGSTITEENQEEETKRKSSESDSASPPRKWNKRSRSSSDTSARDPTQKHKGTKLHGRKSSSAVKDNFK